MKLSVLGVAQDGGVPHYGCTCETCDSARENPEKRRYPTSLQLTTDDGDQYLVDASPDLRFQVRQPVDGVILSHVHYGHVTGLLQFGREVAATTEIPVYCTPGVADFLRENAPYRLLLERGNVDVREIDLGESLAFGAGTVECISVPHRHDMGTDTLAFRFTKERSLYYVSDVDYLTDDVVAAIRESDIALVDGTFWSDDELPNIESVPHPRASETIATLNDADTDVYFTHLNHTNPLLNPESPERKRVEEAGMALAKRGLSFDM